MTDSETIQYLLIKCSGTSHQPVINGQNEPLLRVMAQGVATHELMIELIKNIGVGGVLDHIAAADIAAYQKGVDNE